MSATRRVVKFVFRRSSVPILLLLAGVAAVVAAIAAGSVTWKAVWIGVASSCLTGGLVDGSALLEARRRDRAVLRIAGMRVGYLHQRLLWIIGAVFGVTGGPSDVGGALRGLHRASIDLTAVMPAAVSSRFVSALTAHGCPAGTCQALTAAQPAAISNYSRVRATPLALGALLALLAVALIAQALLTTTRRRRRDFAVVKTLGFLRRQVSAAVAWQATTLAAVALLAGLPLGVAGGRWAWALFAGSAGVSSSATIPLGAIALTIPIALLLANTIAAGPGWAAARIKPAVALRNE